MKRFTLLPLIALGLISNAQAARWNSINNPSNLDSQYEYTLSKLPTKADLALKPWSETYWPTNKGGINYRWNMPAEQRAGFKYSLKTRDELMHMTAEQIALLSPSEKFDIYAGHYDYPLHAEVADGTTTKAEYWRGICDGWSMAAVQFAEPKPVSVTNPDGIVVSFGSSDVKGLLSYYSQIHADVNQIYVGGQCHRFGGLFGRAACDDINPGSLHVVLTNQLGLKNKAFMMDRDPGKEIWNQPVYGYETTILGSAQSTADHGVQVHTIIYYTDELDNSSWDAVVGTPAFKGNKMELDYILDLDANDKIVGGSYINGSDHPDDFWMLDKPVAFDADFAPLSKLIK